MDKLFDILIYVLNHLLTPPNENKPFLGFFGCKESEFGNILLIGVTYDTFSPPFFAKKGPKSAEKWPKLGRKLREGKWSKIRKCLDE